MKVLVFFVCLSLCTVELAIGQDNSGDLQKQAGKKAFDTTRGLYTTLRNVAFPGHEMTDKPGVESRFLLTMPGKILNYFTYFPGKDYVDFIMNPDASKKESVVPPHVMEKWFDLADVVPSSNPMNAQDSGQSLANIYSNLLHIIRPAVLDSKSPSDKGSYAQAVNVLTQNLTDPENVTNTITRLGLYERYRDLYNSEKLKMNQAIEDRRLNYGSIDYEIWFQQQYPSLQAITESEYNKWLIFGEKEKVENYLAYIDSGSSGHALEQARMDLRASGVSSLDRTRTIYPVSFEPADWYRYLLPETPQQPSRDQYQVMLGKLNAKIDAITDIVSSVKTTVDGTKFKTYVNTSNMDYVKSEGESKKRVEKYIEDQFECMADSSNCEAYNNIRKNVSDTIVNQATEYTENQGIDYYSDPTAYIESLENQKSLLESQVQKITALLDGASSYLGAIMDDSNLDVAELPQSYLENNWLQFQFSSESYSKTDNSESESVTSQMNSDNYWWWYGSRSSSYSSKHTTSSLNQLAQAKMKVKGELLRVTIQRPWFRPELFKNSDLIFTESSLGERNTYVSPGYDLTETQFYNTLNSPNTEYILPEYTTAFLLARNIYLEFSGVDSSTVTSTMSDLSHSHSDAGYSFWYFHAASSSTKSKQTSSVQVKKSTDGMTIKIPGTQLIGYYTEKLPRFPPDH